MGERCSSPVRPGQLKLRPKSIFVFSIPQKAFNTTIWGLAAFEGQKFWGGTLHGMPPGPEF